ncbi:MAG: acyltransferase [Leptospiraceae bacterium]|nr:acyltransferase [Leptospiraceae bacterium]MDW7976991.1 acyltransferase [Leptospiraceae bacterium]
MNITKTNLLRIISIIAVLIIHATHTAQKHYSEHLQIFSWDFFYVLINQIARFCVPVFVILSGYGLYARYGDSSISFSIKEFYKRRTIRIVLPFLFWTLVILLWQSKNGFHDFLSKLIYYLTITGIDYHFYFFIIIIQMYILFPLLRKVHSHWLLILLLVFQLSTYSPSYDIYRMLGFSYPIFPSTFFGSWLFYFYLGIYLRQNQDKIIKTIDFKKKIILIIFAIISFSWIIGEYIQKSESKIEFFHFDHFHRYSVLIYSVSVFLLFYSAQIDSWLHKYKAPIDLLASLSFGVYIFHTWILRILDVYIYEFVLIKTILLIVFSFSFMYIVMKLFDHLEKNMTSYFTSKTIDFFKSIMGL